MKGFNANRLLLARRRRGLTQRQVAESAELTVRSVSGYERGVAVPSHGTAARLARVLDFPESFFQLPDPESLEPEGASFRSLSTLTARRRHAVLAAGALAVELNDWLEQRFDLPAVDLPDDVNTETPRAVAAALRAFWGLGEKTIANMVHLLEAKGVRVFSLTEDCTSVDAFSIWVSDRPFVFLNTMKSGERGRFDAAHELGHIVLHRHGGPGGRQAEDQANAFASAFLMPERTMRSLAPPIPSLAALMPIKKRWKVSLAATLRRFYDLGLFTQWHYDRLNIEIAKRGGRKRELGGAMPRESSQLLRKVLVALQREGVGRSGVARQLAIATPELDSLIFGLVLDAVQGGNGATGPGPHQPSLRLVE